MKNIIVKFEIIIIRHRKMLKQAVSSALFTLFRPYKIRVLGQIG